jgi:hypothetical protein
VKTKTINTTTAAEAAAKLMKHFIFCALALCVILTGCSPSGSRIKTEYVEGTVSVDGTPLPEATITFSPAAEGGESASGYSDTNGKYTLSSTNGDTGKGAVAGDYKVTVSKVAVTVLEKGDPKAKKDPRTGEELLTQTEQLAHNVYLKADTTPLKVTVAKGKNKLDLELKSKP